MNSNSASSDGTADAKKVPNLFSEKIVARPIQPAAALPSHLMRGTGSVRDRYLPMVDTLLIDVFERVSDPRDPVALRDLFLSYVEATTSGGDPFVARNWHQSKRLRNFSSEEILNSSATITFVKELFNSFFRDDLYGNRRNDETVILSSGAVCEEAFGLTSVGKAAVSYALAKDWYGYSDSNGLESAREAIAAYENCRISGGRYSEKNVAITMGATQAVSNMAEMFLHARPTGGPPSLVAIPNYPPLVRSISRYGPVRLVPLEVVDGVYSADPLLELLTHETPLVFLQTVANPTGARICENSLQKLIEAAAPSTVIILDECHEFLGAEYLRCTARTRSNVVRVMSLSKSWSVPGMKIGWITADVDIIQAHYERASTGYGGPPSLFYTLIEVISRFDRWRIEGRTGLGPSERAEFSSQYDLTASALERAYRVYLCDHENRVRRLSEYRGMMLNGLRASGFDVLAPAYSINALVFPEGNFDSYSAYREIIDLTNVSTYPSILNFCFGSGGVRITLSRRWADLESGLNRFRNLRNEK